MRDITDLLNRYREASRSLWNNSFLVPNVDFDRVRQFDRIRLLLFSELVLGSLGPPTDSVRGELELDRLVLEPLEPFQFIHVVPNAKMVPIFMNRSLSEGPYWDAEPAHISKDDADLLYIDCFDWDVRGFREFQYYRVRVGNHRREPIVNGRNALMSVEHVRVLTSDSPGIVNTSAQR